MEETLERSGASASFVELAWMPKEQRQSSKLLGFKSFDTYKNVIALMIVMLDRSNIDMEVSDADIESNDCREVSRDNRNVNGVLAAI